MNLAKIDTAKTFILGPVLDADGVAVTTLDETDLKVVKNGSVGDPNGSTTMTHSFTGHYVVAANAGDISALGQVTFAINATTNAAAPVSFQVVTANVYDTFSSTDTLQVDVQEIDGNAAAAGRMRQWITSWTSGTVQSASGTTVKLDAGGSAVNNFYRGDLLFIHNGTGAGQGKTIIAYNGTSKDATIVNAFATTPDATSDYLILPEGIVDVGSLGGSLTALANLKAAFDGSGYGFEILLKEIVNKKEITTANGNTTLYDDDGTTPLYTVSAAYYSTSTKKIRKRLA